MAVSKQPNNQPDLLTQFVGAFDRCDPAEQTVTCKLPDLSPSEAEAFQEFVERHIADKTKVLVLVYDYSEFEDWHRGGISVQLQAGQVQQK